MSNSVLEKKKFVKNSFFNVLYRVMNLVFPLVTTVYISHILRADGVGKVSAAQNFVQYFVLLAPLGLSNYGTREIAKIRNNKKKTDKLFTELFLINFSSTTICVIAYYGLIGFNTFFIHDKILYLVSGLPIIFNYINIEWFYQGNEDYVYIALRSIIVKFISVIAIIVFVRRANDYLVYALIYALGIVGNNVFNILNLNKTGIKLDFHSISLRKHMAPVLILLCSNIAVELYTLLDTSMLNFMCSDEVVGYYTNSIKLVKMVVSLITAIGGVLLPRLSYYRSQKMYEECNQLISNVTKVMLFFCIPSGIGVFLLADKFVLLLYGKTFLPAVLTVKIGTMIIYVLGFSNLFGTQVLLTYNKEKELLMCTCVGAVSNVIMNSFLIPHFQQNGAIVASVISECIVTYMTIKFSKKIVEIKIGLNYWIQILTACCGMGMFVILVRKLVNEKLICIIVSVIIGGLLYLLLSLLLKNEIMIYIKKFLQRKKRG